MGLENNLFLPLFLHLKFGCSLFRTSSLNSIKSAKIFVCEGGEGKVSFSSFKWMV